MVEHRLIFVLNEVIYQLETEIGSLKCIKNKLELYKRLMGEL